MSSSTIPEPGEPIIEVRDLKKIFGTQTVLDGLTMDIHRGETLVVMGGSGCGKSTFLRMLIGSFPPSEGTISMLGNRIDQLDEEGMNETNERPEYSSNMNGHQAAGAELK